METVTLTAEEWSLIRTAVNTTTQTLYDAGQVDAGNQFAKVYHAVAKQTTYDE